MKNIGRNGCINGSVYRYCYLYPITHHIYNIFIYDNNI